MKPQPDHTFDVIIIGAGYAGRYAAARLHTRNPGASMLVIDPHGHAHERARSHEYAANYPVNSKKMDASLPRQATRIRGTVVSLRPDSGECDYSQINSAGRDAGNVRTAKARSFVIATGSRGGTLSGDGSIPMFSVDNSRLRAAAVNARHIAVVGAGLSGIEVACELAERRGTQVSLIAKEILPGSSLKARTHATAALRRLGVARYATNANKVENGRLQLADDRRIACDLIIAAIGFDVEDPFDLGLEDPESIRMTLQHRRFDHVFIAGDAAHQLIQTPAYSASCAIAMPMGVHAAENLNRYLRGQQTRPLQYAQKIRCISLGRRDGIIDFTEECGTPSNRVVTGRTAAFVKEQILKMTVWALKLELRTGLPVYFWPKPSRTARQLADMGGETA